MLNSNRHSVSLSKIIEYVFVILTILQCNSVYMYISNHLEFIIFKGFIIGGWQIILILSALYYSLNNKDTDNGKFYLFLIIYTFILALFIVFNIFYSTLPIKYFLILFFDPIMLILFFYCYFNDNENKISFSFFYRFENIVYILAFISLICYIFYAIGVKFPPNISYKWGGDIRTSLSNFFGLWYAVTPGSQILGISFPIRNSSIFTEAPVYSYVLSVAIFVNIFLDKRGEKGRYVKLLVLLCALLLTQSLNGIILSISAILFKNIFQNKNIIIKIISIILAPVFLLIGKLLFNTKKFALGGINSSYNVRSDDIRASLRAWHDHIIIGNGLGSNLPIQRYMDPLRLTEKGDLGITSNIFFALAVGGLILFIIYITPFALSIFLPRSITYFAMFNILYFVVEGIMNYYIFVLIMAFLWSSYLFIKFTDKRCKLNRS